MKIKYVLNRENKAFVFDGNVNPLVRLIVRAGIPIFDFWWGVLLIILRYRTKRVQRKYYFSICAIFKDESLSLKEWVEYHLLIGVDHFYLYNNLSSDNFVEILAPYIEKGVVTLINWPIHPPSQVPAYQHFHDNYWNSSQWVAFIDLDEYICPRKKDNIKNWFANYENYPSVVMYWKQFGSSGRVEHDKNQLIIEQYLHCWDKFYDCGKSAFNTRFDAHAFSEKNVHELPAKIYFFSKKLLIPPINEFKKFVRFKCHRLGFLNTKEKFTIQINHYGTKSYLEFFLSKRNRGGPTLVGEEGARLLSAHAFEFVQRYCVSADYTIQRFLVHLKINMQKEIKNYYEQE